MRDFILSILPIHVSSRGAQTHAVSAFVCGFSASCINKDVLVIMSRTAEEGKVRPASPLRFFATAHSPELRRKNCGPPKRGRFDRFSDTGTPACVVLPAQPGVAVSLLAR
jgi:hypothetical protein